MSDQINDSNFDLAYGEVLRVLRSHEIPWMDPFQVKVIGADTAVAKAAIKVMNDYPGSLPTRNHGRNVGELSIDEVYLYPVPLSVST